MIARGFVENGARVYISSRNQKTCQDVAQELSALSGGGSCVALAGVDLGKGVAECDLIAQQLRDAGVDKLHVLINNSGCTWGEPLDEFKEQGWDKVMDLNLKGLFFLTRACLPLLKAAASRQDPARTINVASVAGMLKMKRNPHIHQVCS